VRRSIGSDVETTLGVLEERFHVAGRLGADVQLWMFGNSASRGFEREISLIQFWEAQ
jgi:hypothetical protein